MSFFGDIGNFAVRAAPATANILAQRAALDRQQKQQALMNTLAQQKQADEEKRTALTEKIGASTIGLNSARVSQLGEGTWSNPFSATDETGQPILVQQHKQTGELRRAQLPLMGGGQPGQSAKQPGDAFSTKPWQLGNHTVGGPEQASQQVGTGTPASGGAATLRPFVKPSTNLNTPVGSPAWKEAERFKASLRPKPEPTNVYLPSVDPETKQTTYTVVPNRGPVNPQSTGLIKPQTGTGGRGAASITKAIANNEQQLAIIDQAIAAVKDHPQAFGLGRGLPLVGSTVDQRLDPKGVKARSLVSNIGSLQIHDRTGAAMSVHEEKRLAGFVPQASDTPEKIIENLNQLKASLGEYNGALQGGVQGGAKTQQTPPGTTQGTTQGTPTATGKPGRDYGIFGKPPGGEE